MMKCHMIKMQMLLRICDAACGCTNEELTEVVVQRMTKISGEKLIHQWPFASVGLVVVGFMDNIFSAIAGKKKTKKKTNVTF